MLNIQKRIETINSLLEQDTEQSLTYAALECRLTLEYLCYERFKLYFPYLSENDVEKWQPKHIVKQVSDEIDESISGKILISISNEKINGRPPRSKEEFESIKYIPLGMQSELRLNKLHQLWNAVSKLALHIPVPTIFSGNIKVYGDKDDIRRKVSEVVSFLSNMNGNMLIGKLPGLDYVFKCFTCDMEIRRPVKKLGDETVVSCINPDCKESYLIKRTEKDDFEIIRNVVRLPCSGCGEYLEIPTKKFYDLRFEQVMPAPCSNCGVLSDFIMFPLPKNIVPSK